MGIPPQRLKREVTSLEFLELRERVDMEWNEKTKLDHWFASVIQLLKQIHAKEGKVIDLEFLRFEQEKEIDEEEEDLMAEEVSVLAEQTWRVRTNDCLIEASKLPFELPPRPEGPDYPYARK